MFGMGGTEIIVILIVALLFLGPDKLPQAAKTISKGIRDIKRQSRSLQNQIEGDEQIGGAIRDLKSALRGEDAPVRPKPIKPRKELTEAGLTAGALAIAGESGETAAPSDAPTPTSDAAGSGNGAPHGATPQAATTEAAGEQGPTIRMPVMAGEPDPDVPTEPDDDLASLVKPAVGTVAKGS